MKAADKRHLNRLSAIGCIVCRIEGFPQTPCEIHHPRAGYGMGQRAPNSEAIPLCPAHHRGVNHPAVPSIHLDKSNFIAQYGTEAELLEATKQVLAKFDEMGIEL